MSDRQQDTQTNPIEEMTRRASEAVADRMRQMTAELAGVMSRTGILSLDGMDPTVIHRRGF